MLMRHYKGRGDGHGLTSESETLQRSTWSHPSRKIANRLAGYAVGGERKAPTCCGAAGTTYKQVSCVLSEPNAADYLLEIYYFCQIFQ